MITKTDEDIEEFLDENVRTIIMIGATWCGPCKTFKPKFQALADEFTDIPFVYCDVDETRNLTTDISIQSVPTVVSFFNGIEFESVTGPTVDKVKALVEKLRMKIS